MGLQILAYLPPRTQYKDRVFGTKSLSAFPYGLPERASGWAGRYVKAVQGARGTFYSLHPGTTLL